MPSDEAWDRMGCQPASGHSTRQGWEHLGGGVNPAPQKDRSWSDGADHTVVPMLRVGPARLMPLLWLWTETWSRNGLRA